MEGGDFDEASHSRGASTLRRKNEDAKHSAWRRWGEVELQVERHAKRSMRA
jgi:hypothetical protein